MMSVPIEYAIDHVARRWGVAPWELEDPDHALWLHRGLLFNRFEAQATVKRGKRNDA